MANVKLRDGSEVPAGLVEAVMRTLRKVLDERPLVFRDFAIDARRGEASTYIHGPYFAYLREIGLVDHQGRVAGTYRSLLHCATMHDPDGLTLRDPRETPDHRVPNADYSSGSEPGLHHFRSTPPDTRYRCTKCHLLVPACEVLIPPDVNSMCDPLRHDKCGGEVVSRETPEPDAAEQSETWAKIEPRVK